MKIREVVREEILGTGPALEFADLVKVECGDSGWPVEYDIAHERPSYCQSLDDFVKCC